jgi:hypothetical protein
MSERVEKSPNGVTTLGEVDGNERQNNESDDCVIGGAGVTKIFFRKLQGREQTGDKRCDQEKMNEKSNVRGGTMGG